MQDAEIGIGKPIMVGLTIGVAFALLVASFGCGGSPAHPSLASPPFARYIIVGQIEFSGNLTEIVQNEDGNVSGQCGLTVEDKPYDCAFVGVVQPDGNCSLTLKVPRFSPFTMHGVCGARVIGTVNGSGFYGTPFAAARIGDTAWLDLYEKEAKPHGESNEGMRPDGPNPSSGEDALPDFATVSR